MAEGEKGRIKFAGANKLLQDGGTKLIRLGIGREYRPDWRGLLVDEYLTEAGKARLDRRDYDIPDEEQDEVVRNYYTFTLCLGGDDREDMLWAFQAYGGKFFPGFCSVIKAGVVAGLSDREIADYLDTTEKSIFYFVSLFFDIRHHLKNPAYMRQITTAYFNDSAELHREDLEELYLIHLAYRAGWDAVRWDLEGSKCDVKPSVEKMETTIIECFSEKAAKGANGLMANRKNRPTDIDRWERLYALKSQIAQMQKGETLKLNDFITKFCEKGLNHPDMPEEIVEGLQRIHVAPEVERMEARRDNIVPMRWDGICGGTPGDQQDEVLSV